MPRSTLSAVRTPGSDMPSSTSVIATAGRMPTTTVSASSTRDIAAMFPSMRPMNESTISSAEMSISTPRAPVAAIRVGQIVLQLHREPVVHVDLDRHEQALAHLENRDAFHVTPRAGGGLAAAPGAGSAADGATLVTVSASRLSATANASASVALVVTAVQVHAEMDDRLRDLRPDAADDAVGAHQPRGRHRLQQVLRDQRVDGRHAGDVEDGDRRAGLDDALQQVLHHDLRARAVERADERQRQDAVPQA